MRHYFIFYQCLYFYNILSSCSVVSNPLQPHGLQHARLPSPSLSPGACSNSCPLSQWCHPTSLSSVVPFSSRLQSFSASVSFPKCQFFKSGGETIGVSSFNISPSNKYSGLISFRIDWFDLLAVQGTLKSFLQHHNSKASFLPSSRSPFFMVQLSHAYLTTEKTTALTTWSFVGKVMSLLLNTLSRFVIAFLPRSNHLLISWCLKEGHLVASRRNGLFFLADFEGVGWNWFIFPECLMLGIVKYIMLAWLEGTQALAIVYGKHLLPSCRSEHVSMSLAAAWSLPAESVQLQRGLVFAWQLVCIPTQIFMDSSSP